MTALPNHPEGSLLRRDVSWGGALHGTGIRRKVLTTKYSIVYMEKEAWPEKKDFLQEQERGMRGPYSHPDTCLPVCIPSIDCDLDSSTILFGFVSLVVLWIHCLEPSRHPRMREQADGWMDGGMDFPVFYHNCYLSIYLKNLTLSSLRMGTVPYTPLETEAQP